MTMQPQQTPPMPENFWPQLLARLNEVSPRFYQVITKYSVFLTLGSIIFPFATTYVLPAIGINAPAWLTFSSSQLTAIVAALAGLGIGGASVAKTTMQTAGTPPLAETVTPPTKAEMAQLIADIQTELIRIQQQQAAPADPRSTMPVNATTVTNTASHEY